MFDIAKGNSTVNYYYRNLTLPVVNGTFTAKRIKVPQDASILPSVHAVNSKSSVSQLAKPVTIRNDMTFIYLSHNRAMNATTLATVQTNSDEFAYFYVINAAFNHKAIQVQLQPVYVCYNQTRKQENCFYLASDGVSILEKSNTTINLSGNSLRVYQNSSKTTFLLHISLEGSISPNNGYSSAAWCVLFDNTFAITISALVGDLNLQSKPLAQTALALSKPTEITLIVMFAVAALSAYLYILRMNTFYDAGNLCSVLLYSLICTLYVFYRY